MAEQEEIGKPEPELESVPEAEPEPEAEPKKSRQVIQRFPPDVLMSTNKPAPKG